MNALPLHADPRRDRAPTLQRLAHLSSLRSMLVHLDGTPSCAQRLQLAQALAQRCGATLTAVYATMPPLSDMPYTYAASAVSPQALQETQQLWRLRARANFEAAERTAAIPMAWVELHEGAMASAMAQQALYADMLVLGQVETGQDLTRQLPRDFIESVLIACGRPALVIPYAGEPTKALPRDAALVAWKASPEAARALSAALPLLQSVRRVHVVSWAEEPAHCEGQGLDVERYLRLHDIEPIMHREQQAPQDIGERLLSLACDLGAELLVMGCYSQSRSREFLLGGASRTLLRSMTLPVLMSH